MAFGSEHDIWPVQVFISGSTSSRYRLVLPRGVEVGDLVDGSLPPATRRGAARVLTSLASPSLSHNDDKRIAHYYEISEWTSF